MQDKKFIRQFEKKVNDTIGKHNLLGKKEKIIVAASGGKDSTTILYLLQKFGFKFEALHINLHLGKYSENCLENARDFCKKGKIKLHIVDMKKEFGSSMCYIRQNIQAENRITNCMACGVIKKWILNRYARKLKADKIVTGHNLDDEAQTVLINIMRGNPFLSINLGPETGVLKDRKFVSRVKPLYFSAENDIRKYSMLMNLPVNYEKCPCAIGSYRVETRKFLNELENAGFKAKENIIRTFLGILPFLRNSFFGKTKKLMYCEICGEPSRNDMCKACQLFAKAK